MTPNPISITFDIGDGRMVTIETGKLARAGARSSPRSGAPVRSHSRRG